MSALRSLTLAALLSASLSGCGEDDSGGSHPTGFVADGPVEGGSVFLRPVRGGLAFELVAKEIDGIQGVAFRLRFDSAVLRFEGIQGSDAWPEGSLVLAEQTEPGIVVGALGARGQFSGLAAGEVVLGSVAFERIQMGSSPLAFVTERSGVIATDGRRRRDVSFVGGTLR